MYKIVIKNNLADRLYLFEINFNNWLRSFGSSQFLFVIKGTSKKEHFWKLAFIKCDEFKVPAGHTLEKRSFSRCPLLTLFIFQIAI